MLEFIAYPLIVGIVALSIYKIFELPICRRERLNIIDKLDPGMLIDYLKNVPMGMPVGRVSAVEGSRGFSSGALRVGCLLLGLGVGLLVGYWISTCCPNGAYYHDEVIYGGSVLCFGGLGLIAAFVVERRVSRSSHK